MKHFEIRITATDDDNDVSTIEYVSEEPDRTSDDIASVIGSHINHEGVHFEHFKLGVAKAQYIVIEPASDDEGYMYDIYASKEAYDNEEDSIDGGQCTGTLSDAISMSINQ